MLQVTLSDYSIIYATCLGDALQKAFEKGLEIRRID